MGLLGRACVVLALSLVCMNADSIYRWIKGDNFSKIERHVMKVIMSDCKSNSKDQMFLPDSVVTQVPKFNELLTKVWYQNRSGMIEMHNMALNRAMFYSYILQRMNDSKLFFVQPDWNYMFLSTTADVNAHKGIFNASAIYFDTHCHYPNWYTTVDFNKTLELFGPKAYGVDDSYDMGNFLRENTRRTNVVKDAGSGSGRNYTSEGYKMNPWYSFWLPDIKGDQDSVQKFTYAVNIKYSNETGKFIKEEYDTFRFFGPNSPGISEKDESKLPVRFTQPYFDCSGSKKWVISAAAPIVDYMPRYLNWTHLRRQRDFLEVDYNPCRASVGNPGPSFLGGVDKCKLDTTICRAGHRYPTYIEGPYQGSSLEQATEPEYQNGFYCTRSDHLQVLPVVENTQFTISNTLQKRSLLSYNDSFVSLQKRQIENFKQTLKKANLDPEPVETVEEEPEPRFRSRKKRSANFDQKSFNGMLDIFERVRRVNKRNCHTMPDSYKVLPGAVAYGVEKQFDNQARQALRIAHFLTNFYQNVVPGENFGTLKGGNRIHYEHLFGEVLANIMADHKILSSGVFFEPYFFEDENGTKKEYFGPWAFKRDGEYFAIDTAGFKKRYTDEPWYRVIASRWQTNTKGIKKYRMKALIRSDPNGTSTIKHEYYPMGYFAPAVGDGIWSRPHFKCDGRVDNWVITYSIPFIGLDDLRKKHKFRGVVTVDVPLEEIEINQCAQPFSEANAFKNTARCDYKSTDCFKLPGYKFQRGAYRCSCKRGFEYPWKDGRLWFHGSLLEQEYLKKTLGLFSIYDGLKCRESSSSTLTVSVVLLVCALLMSLFRQNHIGLWISGPEICVYI
ncbi:hypothetical protein KUTeg_006852 [Tegillarca granosa]|uniref:GPR158/179 extracellular domain-containing protein n=1 Tax=Tegillarca granosa TaxID=220873 RepID=A0ABQ9FDX8_TEGGR|nr:hypothetical protein KUTeg_006852 [Tegillarca granosa]